MLHYSMLLTLHMPDDSILASAIGKLYRVVVARDWNFEKKKFEIFMLKNFSIYNQKNHTTPLQMTILLQKV